VAAGAGSDDRQFAAARYDENGALDTSFGGDGKVLTNLTSGRDWAWDMAIQTDGKIVAAGAAGGLGGRFGIVRYETDGSLDSTFGGDGKVLTNFTSGWDAASAAAVQSDGKLVAAGSASGAGGRYGVARYEAADLAEGIAREPSGVQRNVIDERAKPSHGSSGTASTSSHGG
jgi:uncharacterized delta-60 repeat protein